jgi:hypothetical protein
VSLPRGPVSVTLYPAGLIGFREHKRRTEFVLPLARVFVLAADAYQQQRKADKRAARKAAGS